jgi:hypothetical protein
MLNEACDGFVLIDFCLTSKIRHDLRWRGMCGSEHIP